LFWRFPTAAPSCSEGVLRKKRRILRSIWIAVLSIVVFIPDPVVLVVVLLLGTFLSFSFIDENGQH
jgi:fatty acid desaturase